MGSLLFLERTPQGFRKRSRFAIRGFVFRSEGRLPSVRILASSLTVPREMLFSSSRRNFIGLILQFELTRVPRYRIISAAIHNLLSLTEFLSYSRADFCADFFVILILYLNDIYSRQFISKCTTFSSFHLPSDLFFDDLASENVERILFRSIS